MNRLAKEDPSFRVSSDEESGQTIIKGMGELHLDIIVDRMKREFKLKLMLASTSSIQRNNGNSEVTYIHKKKVVVLSFVK